jgi:hypothetical protein
MRAELSKKIKVIGVCVCNRVWIPVKALFVYTNSKFHLAKIHPSDSQRSNCISFCLIMDDIGIAPFLWPKSLLQLQSHLNRISLNNGASPVREKIFTLSDYPSTRWIAGKILLVPVILISSVPRLQFLYYRIHGLSPSTSKRKPSWIEHQWYPSLFAPSFFIPVGQACVRISCVTSLPWRSAICISTPQTSTTRQIQKPQKSSITTGILLLWPLHNSFQLTACESRVATVVNTYRSIECAGRLAEISKMLTPNEVSRVFSCGLLESFDRCVTKGILYFSFVSLQFSGTTRESLIDHTSSHVINNGAINQVQYRSFISGKRYRIIAIIWIPVK